MSPRRPRVAIAVEPTILADALADLLVGAGVDEVVNLRDVEAATAATGSFDAALVTVVLPDGLDADVVIELPGTAPGDGESRVKVHGRAARVPVRAVEDILRLLDDYCPGPAPRTASDD